MNNDIKVILDSIDDIGIKMDTGSVQYGQLQIGETKTGEAGTKAIVTNSGSSARAILNFTIPRGDNGVYVGTDEPTDDEVNVWIDPTGDIYGLVNDVQVDGVSVVSNGIANISLSSLEQTLQEILTIIQSGELNKNQVAEIEELIVSYFENKTVEEVEE